MIFVIDNYDSFTFNLVQYFQEMGSKVRVQRNDVVSLKSIERTRPKVLVISPGPGYPQHAGVWVGAIRHYAGHIPFLGVCLRY